ncbi:ExbD/TolR family protein [Polymorphobacter fuscus]|uniref:Biopolymer transporter ExbD n=1 Tax=Sandarakinorhabdus fusca TaxID=1439888 RepID=A0A7C9GNU1_9SPHN|nr:biopolymer transporter ExbD [Polymorphobacter fuscus]KAB7648654.1 biopolymer transporter ExbD [Polymorphobacter fuscus]MQT16210.1 biopolymer transporter ExbD [Polymorphobacter fuscus]NJC07505.1 biopolymer transport protein ExbD [Polymorphobacter fuscus]
MSMNIGSPGEDGSESPMTEINTTPLVDVMLVLLIIFLITVPVVIQTVPLSLPTVTNLPTTTKPENVLLSVDTNCDTFWGQTKVESKQELLDRGVKALKDEIARQEKAGGKIELPEVHIRGDKDMEYRCVGGVIFTMQRAGFLKIGFISEPVPGQVSR